MAWLSIHPELTRLREESLHAEFEELARRQEKESLFEREQERNAVAQKAVEKRDVRVWLEYEEGQKREALRKTETFKQLFARAELEKRFRGAFEKTVAENHLQQIENAIKNHENTRQLLGSSRIRRLQHSVVIHGEAVTWAMWASRHRRELLDNIMSSSIQTRTGLKAA